MTPQPAAKSGELPSGGAADGAVLVDHIKNQDWQARRAEKTGALANDFVDEVADLVDALMRDA